MFFNNGIFKNKSYDVFHGTLFSQQNPAWHHLKVATKRSYGLKDF